MRRELHDALYHDALRTFVHDLIRTFDSFERLMRAVLAGREHRPEETPDPVEIASEDSFPASDPPAWVTADRRGRR
jgi:hypothetical protein